VVAYYARPDDPQGDVRRLIVEEGIGGIVLQKGNGIFRNERGADLPTQIATLTADLQLMALDEGPGVPLFVAIDHEGDGNPFTHLREGFTALPSPMAIGATWDPLAAEAVGRVAGAELEAVGINMLLGPGLDVLAEPRIDSGGDIGTRSFGGSPYWVARLGAAYIRGVHEGGRRRVLTVAKHFPGHGGSDRDPDSGVSTVIAPVNALESVDLAPFAAVTTEGPGDPDRPSITDALMTSHIRYFGLQGNLQDGTPPISFDREGLELLLEQGSFGFAAWRERGGLIVSDSLGVPAVRDWFAPRQDRFPNRLIARTALMAGNDVLLLAQFDAVGAWDLQLRNIVDTLDYFTEEYRRDPGFRARVDEAATRVLAQKRLLYPNLSVETVAVRPDRAAGAVGGAEARRTVDQVSARAVTAWQSADTPPARGDRIVVITPRYRDSRTGRLLPLESPLACRDESCGLEEAEWQRLQGLGPTLVEAMILDQFGPAGLGSIDVGAVSSIAFCQLRQALSPVLSAPPSDGAADEPTTAPSEAAVDRRMPPGVCDPDLDTQALVSQLAEADWIVFAFADLDPDESLRLRGLLLPQVQSLAREQGAHVAVLSFGPPYYIDTTNSAQLHAHYSAYTKTPSAVRAAVRAWFGAGEAPGASPVTVKNADYLLAQVLEPRPGPGMELQMVGEPPRELPAQVTLSVTGLLDHNGHPVPDGTLVRITSEPAAALVGGTAELVSAGGEARGEVQLVAGGTIRLRAETSSGAREEESLIIDLPLPSPTAGVGPTTSPPAVTAAVDDPTGEGRSGRPPRMLDFGLALAAVALVSITATVGPWRGKRRAPRLRAVLWAAAGGLGTYIGYAALVLRTGRRPSGVPQAFDSALCALLGALIVVALTSRWTGLRVPGSRSRRSRA
jgi:beta-N-acetylhexosaminidase